MEGNKLDVDETDDGHGITVTQRIADMIFLFCVVSHFSTGKFKKDYIASILTNPIV